MSMINREQPLPQRGLSRRTLLGVAGGLTLAGAAASLAGCSPAPSTATTIDVFNFGNADEGKVYDTVFGKFSQRHAGVTINHTNVPVPSWADYVTKLATQTAGGNPPDLVNLAIEGTQQAVSRNLLAPLTPHLDSSPVADLVKKMPPGLIDAFTVGGNLYQLPTGWQTMAVFYNPEIFAAAGVAEPEPDWTWDDFLEKATALTGGDVMGFALTWGFFQLHPWWLTNDARAVTDDLSAPNLTAAGFVEAVQFIHDLIRVHKVSPDPSSVDLYSQFAAGRFAMIGTGRYSLPGWSKDGFTSYKAVPWPQRKVRATVIGAGGWGISEKAEDKDLCWKLIEDIINESTMRELAALGQQIPAVASADHQSGDASRDAAQTVLNGLLNDCVPIAAPTFYDTLETVTMRHLQAIVAGEEGVEEGLAKANDEVTAAL